jgi:hypothetical protein
VVDDDAQILSQLFAVAGLYSPLLMSPAISSFHSSIIRRRSSSIEMRRSGAGAADRAEPALEFHGIMGYERTAGTYRWSVSSHPTCAQDSWSE